jgi:hypothetical protein
MSVYVLNTHKYVTKPHLYVDAHTCFWRYIHAYTVGKIVGAYIHHKTLVCKMVIHTPINILEYTHAYT